MVKMSNAVKIFLAFDAPFWPEGLFDVVCADCFLPELWILQYPPDKEARSRTDVGKNVGKMNITTSADEAAFDPTVAERTKEVVTFFACGNLADRLSAMPKREVVEKALDQLDEMFGSLVRFFPRTTVHSCCTQLCVAIFEKTSSLPSDAPTDGTRSPTHAAPFASHYTPRTCVTHH